MTTKEDDKQEGIKMVGGIQILSGRSSLEQRMNMAVVMREKWRIKMLFIVLLSVNTFAMTALSPTAVTAPLNIEWHTKA